MRAGRPAPPDPAAAGGGRRASSRRYIAHTVGVFPKGTPLEAANSQVIVDGVWN
ncbi:MAG: hypothetical protein V3U24_02735 [Candidatus Neomarinimicrobiota bacterium]